MKHFPLFIYSSIGAFNLSKAIVKKLYFSVIVFTVTVVEFIKWLTDRFVMLNQFVFCLKGKRLLIPYRNKWCLGNTFDVGVIFVYKRLGVFPATSSIADLSWSTLALDTLASLREAQLVRARKVIGNNSNFITK